jgi:deazaflavin-dependent oxidoreductase (nitroreductase family)
MNMKKIIDEHNEGVIAEFHANGGKVGGRYASSNILLLHNVGARSGAERVNPLAYVRDGDDMLVVASLGGAPKHPTWYWNLKAHPRTAAEVGTATVAVVASEVADEGYARDWAIVTEAIPAMLDYQKQTTRRLPIFRLTPA